MVRNLHTPLGGYVRVEPLVKHLQKKVGGNGKMLVLALPSPDNRMVEIALSEWIARALADDLDPRRTKPEPSFARVYPWVGGYGILAMLIGLGVGYLSWGMS